MSSQIDYSLYLVTDNTPAILGSKNLVDHVEAAVKGGVTIVQLRDKTSDTAELIRIATKLHDVCKEHHVPLIINDRIDVALVSGAEGVHLGQDDMSVTEARAIFAETGREVVIGVSVNSLEEAELAVKDGADYLGIGTVFPTTTKENTKSIIGTAGLRSILDRVHTLAPDLPTVCIGGIDPTNLQRVLFQSQSPQGGKKLHGIAVVSAIMGVEDPKAAASDILQLVKTQPAFAQSRSLTSLDRSTVVAAIPGIIKELAESKPLCHNMTNLVVQNIAANVAIAIGASPIMSNAGDEAADLAALGGSLVINMGTTTPDTHASHTAAMAAYNAVGGPILFDPVGAGATAARREGTRALLAAGYFTVIKGNEDEIRTVAVSGAGAAAAEAEKEEEEEEEVESGVAATSQVKQRGVDSGPSSLDLAGRVQLVRELARCERNVVVMTGVVDVLSDGIRTVSVANGHELLGEITGSGCTLGTTIASVLAVHREDPLLAALAGVLIFEIASERAGARPEVRGPGTFVPALIDELYAIREESLSYDGKWAEAAKLEFH